jgi:O-antigen ligase
MATQRPQFPVVPAHRVLIAAPRRASATPVQRKASALSPFLQVAPVAILIIGLLLPVEVRVNLAGQTLYAYRIAWMLVAPWIIYQILAGRFRFRVIDAIVGLAALWIVISFAVNEGVARGLPAGLALGLDVLMPYLITRHAIRSFYDFRVLLILLAPVALGVAALMVLESVTQTRFIRVGAASIFGSLGRAEYGADVGQAKLGDVRYGLMRATGPFSHPILAGVFFAGLMPLYYFSQLRGWPRLMGLASGVGAIFTLSSSAFLGIFIFLALAVYDWLQKRVNFLNWPLFLAATAAVLAVLQVVSKNGLIAVLIRYTVNPATGYYRLLIWEFGSKSVAKHPLFGIGYQSFEKLKWMTDSIDTVWLAIAVRNGLPPALLLGGAVILAIVGLALFASRSASSDGRLSMGIAITLTIFFVLGFTVSFFGGMLIWFVMLIAIGTTFGQFGRPQTRRMAPPRMLQERLR